MGAFDVKPPDASDFFGPSEPVVSPRDAADGLPTGKRQHAPVGIPDLSTPLEPSTPPFLPVGPVNSTLTPTELDRKYPPLDRENVVFQYDRPASWGLGVTADDDW